MIDTHCHLSFEEFDNKREEIIENTRKEFNILLTLVLVIRVILDH